MPEVGVAKDSTRDQRLDMFRGLALLMIFINHVPGTIYENYTSRNFGFSDAAEAFVLMSGIAAGLAYSPRFASGSLWEATLKVWARARTLYLVHIATSAMALAIFAGAALWFELDELLGKNNIPPLLQQPLAAIVGLPTLLFQVGYFNILPLYVVLLLATPLLLPLAIRRPMLLLGLSIAVWMLAGQFRLNFPTYPPRGEWFFNPLSWQLLFVAGLLSGTAMRQGRTLVPHNPALVMASAGFVVFVLLWVRIEPLGDAGRDVLGWLSGLGLPFYVTWFDKAYLALPRLLHALALAYLLASLPQVRWFAESRYAKPLTLLGRHGLPVFATGSVLSFALQAVKQGIGRNDFTDGLLLLAGIAVMLALAAALEWRPAAQRAAAPAAGPVPTLPAEARLS